MTPKDMLTNPYFCPMPWTGLMYNFDGKVKNCIRSVERMPIGNLQNTNIQQIVNSDINVSRQQAILERKPVESCQTCYELERGKKDFNIISDRIFYMRELKHIPVDTYSLGNFDLQTVDIRWSNLCNFACVYCSPEFSSKWAAERGISSPTPTQHQVEEFKNYIYDRAPTLKHVYLAGGEPLLIKENLELLKKLNPDVHLRINTNLSKVDTKIFEEVCKFKNVHWIVSVESLEEEYEYIRYGGVWNDFVENLTIINKLNQKITFNMLHFLLNYMSVFNCIDWLRSIGFHPNSFVVGAMLAPDYLNVRHLPDNTLQKIGNELQRRLNHSNGYLLDDSYRNMLHYINTPAEKNLQNSFEQIAKLDQRRNLDSKKIFRTLYKEHYHGKTI